MKAHGLKSISIAEIDASNRLRPVDEGYAALLAEDIAETGRLRQPVEVRIKRGGGYKLIAGGHRLAAVASLGWTEVDAFVFDANDDEALLAEITENVVRHELNPLDRAVFLAMRETVYIRVYPEAAKGGDRGNQHTGGKVRQNEIVSFSQDTAERCGISPRTVQMALSIAKGLSPDIRARIAGTWIAKKQSELLALVKVEPEKRSDVVDLLLEEDTTLTSVKGALRALEGGKAAAVGDDRQKKVDALRKAWDRAGKAARRAWMSELIDSDRIDEVREPLAELMGEEFVPQSLPAMIDERRKAAKAAGYEARQKGEGVDENPYATRKDTEGKLYAAGWLQGWKAAADAQANSAVLTTPPAIEKPSRQWVEAKAESDGYTAYQHGVSRNENPYIDREEYLADAWARGWEQAAAEDADPANAA